MAERVAVSLFSGAGGFDLGMEQAGWRSGFQCEVDPACLQTLAHRWPEVPRWGDVSTLTGSEILRRCPRPEAVIWGSPCQDLSVMGNRAGLEGSRSGLFHHGVRIIREIREATDGKYPMWSVWENVAGALSANRGADFGQVLAEMETAGSCWSEWAVLDARHFGVAQQRRRVFVVSCFDPATAERCPSPLLPVAKDRQQHSASRLVARIGDPSSDLDSPAGSGGPRLEEPAVIVFQPGLMVRKGGHVYYDRVPSLLAQSLGDNRPHLLISRGADTQIRFLTPVECERLMGWPDDHTLCRADGTRNSDTSRYRMIGNGVAAPVARWIGSHLLRATEGSLP